MDYGHPLRFGGLITPSATDPAAAVRLAVVAEELGLDLVVFRDDPDHGAPPPLDTWTLLSWVAGRTEQVTLAATGLDIPHRPPAVLARAAASLDLLSRGRIALGLDAGDVASGSSGSTELPDANDPAAGRAEPSPTAVAEAIEVIHALWSDVDRRPVHLDGEHYRLRGAQPGPSPAHNVPIWLAGRDPAALQLVGRRADGWLSDLAQLPPGALARGNALIDEAARAAGRDPREIRRLLRVEGRFTARSGGMLVGPSDQWIDQLLPLALTDGIGTVVLASGSPDTLRQFAAEVAPGLREAVAAERSRNRVTEREVPSIVVRRRRRDGIDYDAVPSSLANAHVEPGDAGYSRLASNYLRGGEPGLILLPRTTSEVVDALAFARAQPVPLGIRSAGHGISGRSTNDGGIVVDLRRLNEIQVVDEATRRVRIGPGARWAEVAIALAPHGWALSSGDSGGVGVGGLATAGGIGWLAREHGLTIDHLRSAELVLADGSVVRASAAENPDLLWAVRGAGANLGIVTSFEFEVDEVGDIGFAQLAFDAGDVAGFLQQWAAAVEAAPRDLTSFLTIGGRRRGQAVIAYVMVAVDSADPATVIDRLQPIAALAPLVGQRVQILPYHAIVTDPGVPHEAQGQPISRASLVEHITPEIADEAAQVVLSGVSSFFQIRALGGATSDVPADATAWAHRSANFSVTAFGWSRRHLDAAWDRLHEHADGLYLSFETDPRPERIEDAFPPATLARLRELKHRYDPDDVFRDNFSVAGATSIPSTLEGSASTR